MILGFVPTLFSLGCTDVWHVTGFQRKDPTDESGEVRRWPAGALATGWGLPDIGKHYSMDMSCWCDVNGNWGISNMISRSQVDITVTTQIEFGHIENRDFRTFTPIATHSTEPADVQKSTDAWTEKSGSADKAIESSFFRINAARPTVHILQNSWFPFAFKTNLFLTAVPDQPYVP